MKRYPLNILLFFCISGFVIARLGGILSAGGVVNSLFINGIHIHHFVYGIILLVFGACASLATIGRRWYWFAVSCIGFGLGVIFEDFWLWIKLQDKNSTWLDFWGLIIALVIIIIPALVIHLSVSKLK